MFSYTLQMYTESTSGEVTVSLERGFGQVSTRSQFLIPTMMMQNEDRGW